MTRSHDPEADPTLAERTITGSTDCVPSCSEWDTCQEPTRLRLEPSDQQVAPTPVLNVLDHKSSIVQDRRARPEHDILWPRRERAANADFVALHLHNGEAIGVSTPSDSRA
jgi:hypothetical protein